MNLPERSIVWHAVGAVIIPLSVMAIIIIAILWAVTHQPPEPIDAEHTSVIIAKDDPTRLECADTSAARGCGSATVYRFAMQNGDVVKVDFYDYSAYEVGQNYTYHDSDVVN